MIILNLVVSIIYLFGIIVVAANPITKSSVYDFNELLTISKNGEFGTTESPLKTCPVFGFASNRAKFILSSLSATIASVDNISVVDADPKHLFQLGGGDIAIGYINKYTAVDGASYLLACVQGVIEGIIATKQLRTGSKIIIITDGLNDSQLKSIKESIQKIVQNTFISYESAVDQTQVIVHAVPSDSSEIQEDMEIMIADNFDVKQRAIFTISELTSFVDKSFNIFNQAANVAQINDSKETDSIMASSRLVDDLVETISTKMGVLMAGLKYSLTPSQVTDAVFSIVKDHSIKNEAFIDKYKGTKTLKDSVFRARVGIANVLRSIHRRLIESAKISCVEGFESAVRRIPPNTKLVKNLRLQKEASLEDFRRKLDDIRQGPEIGLFSNEVANKYGEVVEPTEWERISSSFFDRGLSTKLQYDDLRQYFYDICSDREKQLFLQGIYNPYIRDKPYPPTKVSINYLYDYREAYMALSYDKLYDEGVDGPAINRAEALTIPGVSLVPFNPNEYPSVTMTKKKPWWEVLVDFYRDQL